VVALLILESRPVVGASAMADRCDVGTRRRTNRLVSWNRRYGGAGQTDGQVTHQVQLSEGRRSTGESWRLSKERHMVGLSP